MMRELTTAESAHVEKYRQMGGDALAEIARAYFESPPSGATEDEKRVAATKGGDGQ